MKEEALIKDATKPEQSKWRNMIDDIADKYHVKEIKPITKTNTRKTLIQKEIGVKINENIEKKMRICKNQSETLERKETGCQSTCIIYPLCVCQLISRTLAVLIVCFT